MDLSETQQAITYINPTTISIRPKGDQIISCVIRHHNTGRWVEGLLSPQNARDVAKLLLDLAEVMEGFNKEQNNADI